MICCSSDTTSSGCGTKYLLVDSGRPAPLQPPVDPDSLWDGWAQHQRQSAEAQLSETIIGDASAVRSGLDDLVARTGADEILVQAEIFDHAARVRSYEIVAEASRD